MISKSEKCEKCEHRTHHYVHIGYVPIEGDLVSHAIVATDEHVPGIVRQRNILIRLTRYCTLKCMKCMNPLLLIFGEFSNSPSFLPSTTLSPYIGNAWNCRHTYNPYSDSRFCLCPNPTGNGTFLCRTGRYAEACIKAIDSMSTGRTYSVLKRR